MKEGPKMLKERTATILVATSYVGGLPALIIASHLLLS